MPLITRRSSTRATPRGLFGNSGSISRHSASDKSYLAISKAPFGSLESSFEPNLKLYGYRT
jgi:hypothetical protein